MKKKILSFAIACLMIMTAVVTTMPAVSAEDSTPTRGVTEAYGTTGTVGATISSITPSDEEVALATQGYTAYVKHSSITSETANAVEVKDGVYGVPFKWLTPGDATEDDFDAFIAANVRSDANASTSYIAYDGSNAATDTAWGYANTIEGSTIVLLKNVWTLGPAADVNGIIDNGGGMDHDHNVNYDGNGFTHTMENIYVFGNTGNNGPSTTGKVSNIHLVSTCASGNTGLFRLRSYNATPSELTLENCTFEPSTATGSPAGNFYYDVSASSFTLNMVNCLIKSAAANTGTADFLTNIAKPFNINLTRCTVDATAATAKTAHIMFRINIANSNMSVKLDSCKIDAEAREAGSVFFYGAQNGKLTVDMNNCDVNASGYKALISCGSGKTGGMDVDVKNSDITLTDCRSMVLSQYTSASTVDINNSDIEFNYTKSSAHDSDNSIAMFDNRNTGAFDLTASQSRLTMTSSYAGKADEPTNYAYKPFVFRSQGGTCPLDVDLTNVTIDGGENVNLMRCCYNNNTAKVGNTVGITDCDINVAGSGFVDINRGNFTIDGNTLIQVGGIFLRTSVSAPVYFYVNDTATIVAEKLAERSNSLASRTQVPNVISTNPNFYYTSAEATEATYTAPTLVTGASVRTTAETEGLRFTGTIKDGHGADEFGLLVTLTSNLESTEFTAKALADAGVKTYKESAAKLITAMDGYTRFDTALLGIADVKTSYSARAYAKYSTIYHDDELADGEVAESTEVYITVYSEYSEENNARSLGKVADAAYNDLQAYNEAEGYVCKIEDGKYSPYDVEQRAVLKKYADLFNEAQ